MENTILATPLMQVSKTMLNSLIETIASTPEYSGRAHSTQDGGIVFIDSIGSVNVEKFAYILQIKFGKAIDEQIMNSLGTEEELSINDFDFSEFTFVKHFVIQANADETYKMFSFETL